MKKPVIVLLHVGYWIMYSLLWITIIAGFLEGRSSGSASFPQIAERMPPFLGFVMSLGMLGFYSFYTFLFSKFFKRKKILLLCTYGLLVSLLGGLIGEIALSVMIGGVGDNKGENIFPNHSISEILLIIILLSVNVLANGTIGLVIRGFIASYSDIKLKEDLNKKNYEMELALMKAQLNPHFLFNTINNIDVLIQKDPVKASGYLNKLSDIMRFMLYEIKTEKIELTKELSYIQKYMELQKIRTSNPEYVNYSVKGDVDGLMIAPFLFIPFIENAFKHSENRKTDNSVNVNFVIEKNKIMFHCENNYSNNPQLKPEYGGLGNELICKRLALLYPDKHELEIFNEDNAYKIKLSVSV